MMEGMLKLEQSDSKERESHSVHIYEHRPRAEEAKAPNGRFSFVVHEGGRINEENQDRILIDPEQGLYVCVDGMGGPGGGKRAAEIVAEEIKKDFALSLSPEEIQQKAHQRM